MNSKRYTLTILFLVAVIFSTIQTTFARSVYVIGDTEISKLQAYKIVGTSLTHQINYTCQSDPATDAGAVGLAIDESDYGNFLFATFEYSDEIELVNARTMKYTDSVTAPGATNLAGITIDASKGKLYVVDRWTNHLYSYSWDPVTKALTPNFDYPYYVELESIEIGGGKGAFGIALDYENGLLYVGDNTDDIKYYDTDDWSKKGEISVTCNVIGIAIDVNNQLLYYGSIGGDYGQGDTHLYQYDISAQDEDSVVVGSSVAGIAVDQATSLVYLTTYGDGDYDTQDRLFVYDVNLAKQWSSDYIGNPAGVAVVGNVSYKPPLFTFSKVDVNEPNTVLPGDYITYTITYGPNGYDHNDVLIIDYLPFEVDYDELDLNYNPSNHTYTWNIGYLSSSASQDSVSLTVKANQGAAPNASFTNYCEIESDIACTTATADTNVGSWDPNSDTIYVDDTSLCNPGTGMSWRYAYVDLQDALERASDGYGSEIWVAAGQYRPTTNPDDYDANFALVNGVDVYGGFAGYETSTGQRNWIQNRTILDGDLNKDGTSETDYIVKALNLNQSTVLDGFIIRHGDEAAVQCYSSSTEITNCIIEDSSRGVRCTNSSSVKITNTNILGCCGSGVYSSDSDITLTNCHIADNTHEEGGVCGISCSGSDLTVKDCAIEKNDRSGISIYNPSSATITNNRIRKNGLHGIECSTVNSEIDIKNNWIHTNGTYSTAGNGIYIGSGGSTSTIRNNTIVDNNDCGIEIWGGAPVSISNCILWANGGDQLLNCTATYSCIQNWTDGEGNINSYPSFLDPNDPNHDYHLDSNSPCIDAGDTDPNYDGETDIDGEPRKMDGDANGTEIVDMGADEYYWSRADYNKDEIVNFLDYAIFSNPWQNEDANISLDDDNDVDLTDLYHFRKDWLWQAGWEKEFSYGCTGFGGDGGFGKFAQFEQEIEQQQAEPAEVDTEKLVEFLEAIWEQDEGLKDYFTEEQWQEFVESVKSD